MPGFVYILSNPAMPKLLKIGRTERLPSDRAAELQTSGVPMSFRVECAIWFDDYVKAEQDIHEDLDDYRICDNREFFAISVPVAISRLMQISMGHATGDCYSVRRSSEFIDHSDYLRYAVICGVHPDDLRKVINKLSADEWRAATNRLVSSRNRQGSVGDVSD